jgi:hypothetical protein
MRSREMKGDTPMTKREMMQQKIDALLHEVKRMSEAIARMEHALHVCESCPDVDAKGLIERCAELHARLEDIRNIVDVSQQLVDRGEEIEEPDLWL